MRLAGVHRCGLSAPMWCGSPHHAVEPRHEWLRSDAPRRDCRARRRPGALAARPAPLRHHVLRRQRVDRGRRGRPDHQRARRGRGGGRARGSIWSTAAARGSSSTGSCSTPTRARSSSSLPASSARRSRGAGDDDRRHRRHAGAGVRADGWEDLGAPQPLYLAGEYGEAAGRGRELAEAHRYPGAALQPCVLREPRRTEERAIEHLRLAIERSDRYRSFAAGGSDFDPIRDDPAFKELVG